MHKMRTMGFTGSDICTHCTLNTTDDYLHTLWLFPPIQDFWEELTTTLSLFLGCSIQSSPSVCILSDLDILNACSTQIIISLLVTLTIAKKTILLNWRRRGKIKISQWLDLLTRQIGSQRLSCTKKQRLQRFKTIYWTVLRCILLLVS